MPAGFKKYSKYPSADGLRGSGSGFRFAGLEGGCDFLRQRDGRLRRLGGFIAKQRLVVDVVAVVRRRR